MKLVKLLRSLLRLLLLRGPTAQWWSLWKCRQLDRAYVRFLGKENAASTKPPGDPPLACPARSGNALETILFIGDCMWEQNELFPEFRRIASLEYFDLNPSLQENPAAPRFETVARSLEAFVMTARNWEPDVILFYARPSLLSDVAFELLRRKWKCPLLGMNLDDRVQFFPYEIFASGDDNYGRWAKQFDLNLTNAYASLDWYRSRGCAVRYFPQGFHLEEQFKDPPTRIDYDYRFSFLGSWKKERAMIVDRLRRAGAEISLFGKGWPDSQWAQSASSVFRRSQINLGIGFAQASARITTTKGRDFECPGVGACYLTTYNWELPRLYEIGKEILCYRDIEELLEVYQYHVIRPAECLRVAQAAHRRCLAEHTWEKRFRKVFAELGFKV